MNRDRYLRGVAVMAVVNSEEAKYQTQPKQVLAHVALCGLEGTQHQDLQYGRPQRNTFEFTDTHCPSCIC